MAVRAFVEAVIDEDPAAEPLGTLRVTGACPSTRAGIFATSWPFRVLLIWLRGCSRTPIGPASSDVRRQSGLPLPAMTGPLSQVASCTPAAAAWAANISAAATPSGATRLTIPMPGEATDGRLLRRPLEAAEDRQRHRAEQVEDGDDSERLQADVAAA